MGGAVFPSIAGIVMNKLLYFVVDKTDFELPFICQLIKYNMF